MNDLTIITWLWGNKFDASDVRKLRDGIARNLTRSHRFLCCSDRTFDGIECCEIPNLELTKIKGCFPRLRMFDPEWQKGKGERFVCVDLDTVITGQLDPVFDRDEPFVIMQGGNSANPCPYNGALFMLKAGAYPEVWSTFSIDAAHHIPFYAFPDDQAWLAYKIPIAAGWKAGPETGVYVYQKPGWPGGKLNHDLPKDARLVTFINKTPKELMHLDWVRKHWALKGNGDEGLPEMQSRNRSRRGLLRLSRVPWPSR